MEREANYAAVGAFVLVIALVGALFVYCIPTSREHKIFRRYEIYFDGSVSGLERGAAVRYLGSGWVASTNAYRSKGSRTVQVMSTSIHHSLSDRTLASSSYKALRELLYIDLQQLRADLPLPCRRAGNRVPVIRSARSRFDLFLAACPTSWLQRASSSIAPRGRE